MEHMGTTEVTADLPPAPLPPQEPPADPYLSALKLFDGDRLRTLMTTLGLEARGARSTQAVEAIHDRLAQPGEAAKLIAVLGHESKLALGLFGLVETPSWPTAGLELTLGSLGIPADEALNPLLDLGLLAPRNLPPAPRELVAHPAALAAARTVLPNLPGPPAVEKVVRERESDGLEPTLRLAALWQRLEAAPLRLTMQNTLYKRDRERLEDDPALAGPIADALEPLPDMVPLWLALARSAHLIAPEPGTDRIVPAGPAAWMDVAFHFPQMLAVAWLGLRAWHEQGGMQQDGTPATLALPFLRPAALLWLATLPEGAWTALDDLAALLDHHQPGWDRPVLDPNDLVASPFASHPKGKTSRSRSESPSPQPIAEGGPLGAMLLGPAYQLGLIRAGEEPGSGRRLVQLSSLGRYVLAIGPPPPPRPPFDQFLFVQPNFEIVAYRQGLNPSVIGQLSRFLHWVRVGGALELKLTAESIYRGLEGGLTPQAILDRLARHASRPLPPGVAEAVRTWSTRRDRLAYHAAATLMEFATEQALEAALESWPPESPAPTRITDRLLLVDDEQSIPFIHFRMAGSRDYRRPLEACVEVEPGGVTLALDLSRSDLFVDAELARFAEELPRDVTTATRRRFRITPETLAKASDDGLTLPALSRWFQQRTGADVPPALRLLLHAATAGDTPLPTTRPLLLHTPNADFLDGLLQHPTTRGLLGDRLGPTTVVVPDEKQNELSQALADLGLKLDEKPRTQ